MFRLSMIQIQRLLVYGVHGLLLLTLTSCGRVASDVMETGSKSSATQRSEAQTSPSVALSTAQPTTVAPAATPPTAEMAKSVAASPSNISAISDSVRVLSCRTTGGLVNDPDGPLNVRREPNSSQDNVVGSLENGALVSIVAELDNWWQIDAPEAGWVSKNLVDSGCNEKIARIEFPPNAVRVVLSDRFAGTGYHHYQIEASAGQQLTLATAAAGSPLPFVLTPGGVDLTKGVGNTNVDRWSGQLPEDGDYTIAFDSNFRGYTYDIILEIE